MANANCYEMKGPIKHALLLVIVSICLFGYALNYQSGIFREYQAALLSVSWMLLICITIWCGIFLFLTFRTNDLPLVGLLLIGIFAYFIGYAAGLWTADAIVLLIGVALGKGARFFLEVGSQKSKVRSFSAGLVVLLAFSSWWHLDVSHNFYPGTRWTGLWDNPNTYGMLMEAGVVLAIGLLAGMKKEELRMKKLLPIILLVAAGMMAIGLVFSYSRGAWLGTTVGLLYLAKVHGKFKWRFVLPGIFVVVAIVFFFWNATPDSSPWLVKRMDLGRPSAQHRVAAWKAGFEIMREHPFGVGWNNEVGVYQKKYSPPEGGAAAITTNDYLMLGTQLGLPGLFCFVGYIWLSLRRKMDRLEAYPALACRAGALAMLVEFWFDSGLFKLATASVFWILLELGTSDLAVNRKCLKTQCFPSQPA
jgi:O-antigen ligase